MGLRKTWILFLCLLPAVVYASQETELNTTLPGNEQSGKGQKIKKIPFQFYHC